MGISIFGESFKNIFIEEKISEFRKPKQQFGWEHLTLKTFKNYLLGVAKKKKYYLKSASVDVIETPPSLFLHLDVRIVRAALL